ncbi:hypothetical protein DUNSADRAFT_17288 [Dunaliella salina]|uniref:XPG-I domain-containing protein n=1 Tax=Dunaliella salina TaxID=3046 RepID=A0ABQ7G236_DUNSA|nr:hypothetical protein DUNSADRAFT_17288 [Dunaliella salina]|eukprot:KAF5828650.1 hypothetical protein DUNSADRAFT_17288 [Dunaliella salina]
MINYEGGGQARCTRLAPTLTWLMQLGGQALKAEPEPFRFIVAPYEADAQCAYLALTGRVDAVITDDSDLLCYGCPRVLFKTDFWAGTAQEIRLEDLAKNTKPDFLGWDVDLFQELCVLSGCDFLDNVPNRAIMKVHKGLSEYRSGLKYIRWLRTVAGADVPPNYELSFLRARATFRHQLVYCPDRQECLHLTPVPEEGLRIEEAMGIPLDLLQLSPQESYDTKSSGQNSQSSSSRGLISSNNSSSQGPISSSNSSTSTSSSSSADSIGDCDDNERGCGSAISGDSPSSFLGPMVPPDVAAAVARGDLDARTKQPFCASTLIPTFTPEHARALGLRDVTGATESHGKTASDQSSASTSSSRGNSNSSSGSSQAASTEAAVAAAQGQGGEQGASNSSSDSSSARALRAEAADSVPERKRSASVWEAAKGVSAETSLPNLSIRPPLTRRSRFQIQLTRPSRGVSPAALPCQPLHPRHSFGTTKLSTISSSSCSCCHTSSSKISSRMSVRPIIALGHSLARSAPMLLRRVFI